MCVYKYEHELLSLRECVCVPMHIMSAYAVVAMVIIIHS